MKFFLTLLVMVVMISGCRRWEDPAPTEAPEIPDVETAEPLTDGASTEAVALPEIPSFDYERHESALLQLAPIHHARMLEAAQAKRELEVYETSQESLSPEELKEDEQWLALKKAVDEAEMARLAVRSEITSRIRNRMRHEFAVRRAQRDAGNSEDTDRDEALDVLDLSI